MTVRIRGSNVDAPVPTIPDREWAHRSIASSSRQKVFEQVLSHQQGGSRTDMTREEDTLHRELNSLQTAYNGAGGHGKAGTSTQVQAGSAAASNPLATSTLLELTALTSSRGDNLNRYIGTATAGAAAARGSATTDGPPRGAQQASTPIRSAGTDLGTLSARFESGEAGVDAIGYDSTGGTSYGTYQIASRPGTMRQFINYLEEHAPQWAQRLRSAGREDTGSRYGAMPREWQRIAAEDPKAFGKLQHDFIEETHYRPALEEIQDRTGVDVEKHSKALQEVLWSTAVQHGSKGAVNIFCKAINREGRPSTSGDIRQPDRTQGQELIQSVYSSRSRQFGSSSSRVRGSVQRRFEEEKRLALDMLSSEGRGISAKA